MLGEITAGAGGRTGMVACKANTLFLLFLPVRVGPAALSGGHGQRCSGLAPEEPAHCTPASGPSRAVFLAAVESKKMYNLSSPSSAQARRPPSHRKPCSLEKIPHGAEGRPTVP